MELDRRFLLSCAVIAPVVAISGLATSQDLSIGPLDTTEFAAKFEAPGTLNRVFADVAFIQSWRVELAPRGYESQGNWGARATENRIAVRELLGKGNVVAAIQTAAGPIEGNRYLAPTLPCLP